MKMTVDFGTFQERFDIMSRKDQFSSNGLRALFDYLEDLENDLGEEIEVDVIALCCDYVEYESFEQLQKDYDNIKNLENLYDYTPQVIEFEGGLIIQSF
jgi:hypothetical protein